MKLPKDGADVLSKDGFNWIALKVICQVLKGQKKVKFWYVDILFGNFLKSGLLTFI